MPYHVVLIFKSGGREAHDAWNSPRRTPAIGEVIELPIGTRVIRAIVKGIARPPTHGPEAGRPEADEHFDLVIAREI